MTIESSKLSIVQSNSYRDLSLNLKIKSAIASEYPVKIENLEELKSVKINQKEYYLEPQDGKLTLPLKAGKHNVKIEWRDKNSSSILYQFPTVNLEHNSSNSTIELNMPYSRWILYSGGALMGPAVLLWGVMFCHFKNLTFNY